MSNKTARTLQLTAVILFALALLFTVVSIFVQEPLKRLFGADPETAKLFSIPVASLISVGFRVLLSVICLVVIARRPSRGAAIALVIIAAVLLFLAGSVTEPLISMLIINAMSAQGMNALASYTALQQSVSMIGPLFTVPAGILMLLAFGGCIPKKD